MPSYDSILAYLEMAHLEEEEAARQAAAVAEAAKAVNAVTETENSDFSTLQIPRNEVEEEENDDGTDDSIGNSYGSSEVEHFDDEAADGSDSDNDGETVAGMEVADDKNVFPYLGRAHPTADDDASEGSRGFVDGKRGHGPDSPSFLKHFRASIVRTAIGLCYVDLEALCPPTIVYCRKQNDDIMADLWTLSEHDDHNASVDGVPSAGPVVAPTPPMPIFLNDHEINGCFAIRPSPLGGLGSFALRDLERGEHILVERPLLRTDSFHLTRELDRLTPAQRAMFFALHGYHPDRNASEIERIWTANTFVAGALEGIFPVASRFNHACKPNVGYHYDRRHDVLVMTMNEAAPAGTELLISYGNTPAMLFHRFGFRCTCGACTGFSEETAKIHYDQLWS
ncbi:DUF1772 domain containing protein [Niveomyces insectorum RCEF 264]|uniref:DUF1772 domain containing protein n=1 Tax=Niveomyces insectorum RCEF 264 TaxID=1081102 RepID=A0A167VNH0_9HYPO|nr:DUF1772 domain containing protein [Niveomyces insectorum RCEF 264]